MPNARRRVVKVRMQLVAVNGTTDLWQDMMRFMPTMGVTRVRGRLVLADKSGNFRAKVGIQTSTSDEEACDAPVSPASGTGVGYVSTVSKNFIDFDPTGGTEGNIDTKDAFRLGVFYSSTDASVSRGDVILELYIDA